MFLDEIDDPEAEWYSHKYHIKTGKNTKPLCQTDVKMKGINVPFEDAYDILEDCNDDTVCESCMLTLKYVIEEIADIKIPWRNE